MKKLLAILLALMMVLISAAALAESGKTIDVTGLAEPSEAQTLVIPKNYDVQAPAGAELPPDKLTFTLVTHKVEDGPYTDDDMPLVGLAIGTDGTIAGGTKTSYDVTISLPSYKKVGVFYYEFEESDNGVAGVTYIKNKITMRVTVIQDWDTNKLVIKAIAIREEGADGKTTDEDGKLAYDLSKKVDSLENKYEAGSLTLKKIVEGNMGDQGKEWNFTITLKTPQGKTAYSKITYSTTGAKSAITKIDGTETTATVVEAGANGWTEKIIEVKLAHDGTITFDNIPKDVTYSITEAEADTDGYVTTPQNESGTITAKGTSEAEFNNTKEVKIDTGIALDSTVYMLIMALALAGFVALKIFRREEN